MRNTTDVDGATASGDHDALAELRTPSDISTSPQVEIADNQLAEASLPNFLRAVPSKAFDLLTREVLFKPPKLPELQTGDELSKGLDDVSRSLTRTMGDAVKFMWRETGSIFGIRTAISTIVAGTPLAWSYLSGKIVGQVAEAGTVVDAALVGAGTIFAISIGFDVISRAMQVLSAWEVKRVQPIISKVAARVIHSWSYEQLEDASKRSSVDRFTRYANSLFITGNTLIDGATNLISAGVAAALTWSLHPAIAICAASYMVVRVRRDFKEARVSFEINRRHTEPRRELAVEEGLTTRPKTVRDTKQVGKAEEIHQEAHAKGKALDEVEYHNDRRVQFIRGTLDLIPAGIMAFGVTYMGAQFAQGFIKIPDVVMYINYLWALTSQCRSTGFQTGILVSNQVYAAECLQFVESEEKPKDGQIEIPYHSTPPQIELKDVSVERGGNTILDVPHLVIKPGEIIGIVGKEGAGKTTLVKTILGFREATEGDVTLSWGAETYLLNDVHIQSWQRMIGNYSQDFEAPEGMSVRRVQWLGEGRSERELSLKKTLSITHVDEFITDEEGLDSQIGPGWRRGRNYSGGQIKLIGMGPAIRSLPSLLVLDEPTANISKATAFKILKEFCDLARLHGMTVLIVSHNSENFMFVDRVMAVDDARIVQDGSPRDLIKGEGPYRDILVDTANANLNQLQVELVEDPSSETGFALKPKSPLNGNSKIEESIE